MTLTEMVRTLDEALLEASAVLRHVEAELQGMAQALHRAGVMRSRLEGELEKAMAEYLREGVE